MFRINPDGHGCSRAQGELGWTQVWETGASTGDGMVLPSGRTGCRPVTSQPTSDSDDMPSSQTESNPFLIYIASSLKLLVSGAHLPDCSETLPAGLGAPVTFVLHAAARLNSLKRHSDLPQLLQGTGQGTLSSGRWSPACGFGISPTGPDLNESGDGHEDALPTSPHTAGHFYEALGPEHIFITFF